MGFMSIVNKIIGAILKVILFPIRPIISPVLKLKDAMMQLQEILIKLVLMAPKILSLFQIFTDPSKVIKDVLTGLIVGAKMIIETIFDSLFGTTHKNSKYYLGKLKEDTKDSNDPETCFGPSLIEIILLVLCPPLAVFMRKGLSAILIILVTFLLTYFYYIPGLVYASLHVL
jgi:uncharacterized membrane protein YqaE (UPF0057 family)